MERELICRVTIKDCEVQTFRSGGKGGQNQNVRETGVRVIHRPSGAVGEARDERYQLLNKRLAFRRMGQSKEFKRWIDAQIAADIPESSSKERIRTYNMIENYAKDHRTKKLSKDLSGVLDGDLDQLR